MVGCIVAEGTVREGGYVMVWDGDRQVRAHRKALEDEGCDIPSGMLVLHSCGNPACVNTDHLYLGNHSDNQHDSVRHGTHRNARKTHCQNGHPFEGENLMILADGRRKCRTCKREYERRRRLG